MNCYECEYRGTVPGDAHSCCKHPKVKSDVDLFTALVVLISGGYSEVVRELNIQADPYGVKAGWFMWPTNFDPVWLRNCDGFRQKEC